MDEASRRVKLLDVWALLTREERRLAAEAFWQSASGEEQAQAERVLAQRMKFRPQSVHRMPAARKAEYFVAVVAPHMPEYLDAILVSFHLGHRREMMSAFLDALGIAHERGEIKTEGPIAPPDAEALRAARAALGDRYPEHDLQVYFATLLARDPATWAGLAALLGG